MTTWGARGGVRGGRGLGRRPKCYESLGRSESHKTSVGVEINRGLTKAWEGRLTAEKRVITDLSMSSSLEA